ncbi:hypothetical protein DPMN_086703 [Dreissena polymorpha]|uniref:Uncharacterized protein n=1 Tax=Dreissena polymorpha TaxID=45954 RepID=A0A9D4KQX5_DREPO|nr:hypothetical protein DPMN_086703 [Dreissena polymorpha]
MGLLPYAGSVVQSGQELLYLLLSHARFHAVISEQAVFGENRGIVIASSSSAAVLKGNEGTHTPVTQNWRPYCVLTASLRRPRSKGRRHRRRRDAVRTQENACSKTPDVILDRQQEKAGQAEAMLG